MKAVKNSKTYCYMRIRSHLTDKPLSTPYHITQQWPFEITLLSYHQMNFRWKLEECWNVELHKVYKTIIQIAIHSFRFFRTIQTICYDSQMYNLYVAKLLTCLSTDDSLKPRALCQFYSLYMQYYFFYKFSIKRQ